MFQKLLLTISIVVLAVLPDAAVADCPPKIVFILADDLGYGDLSCFGQSTLKTPHLDRLASEGMKLTRKQAVLKDHWKAVRVNWNADPDSPIELYDLSKDESEQTNVATSHSDVVAEMADIMKREHTPLTD